MVCRPKLAQDYAFTHQQYQNESIAPQEKPSTWQATEKAHGIFAFAGEQIVVGYSQYVPYI